MGELNIDVKLDKEAKTITISDKGIGMTAEEVDKYLNQVAFSGAEEFVNKYKGQNENNIIGQFGLGLLFLFHGQREGGSHHQKLTRKVPRP